MVNVLKPIASKLTVNIRYAKGTRVKCVSHVTVWLGDIPVAAGMLVGRYSQEQAVAELRKKNKAFSYHHGYPDAVALNLC